MNARLLLVVLCGAVTACSSFEAKWHAAKSPATRWDGRWTSAKHTSGGGPAGGRLRCVLEETVIATNCFPPRPGTRPACAHALRADFHANWKIFSSNYTMTLMPEKNSRTNFRGTHDLPAMFGGTYRYSARIAGDRFTAHYDSSYDHGTFDLTRVRP